ncbi:MAG: hypothetical protein GWO40_10465 [Gammaproteobacteria bacterium]|nr:hypothetical protein [Gammaproteobacteria bacterium]NIR91460.1 hypothetical protein [Gammaproteobacteria bacterium]NIU04700.1 hypothetical protein [Gammaproteobacteria bacterium]NIV51742.1 hypothetical protein [Gammaproteobacteria bacterium]NIV76648.1 hypothetical protein [Gammaproteobacteria bacterium]
MAGASGEYSEGCHRRRIVGFARFLDLTWSEDDVTDVLHYLDSRYYGFGEGSVDEGETE